MARKYPAMYMGQYENEMIPNTDALYRHWKRACWVLDFWKQADRNTMSPKPLSEYGWKVQDDHLTIEWDTDDNMGVTIWTPSGSK